jgi:hypothetical protein
MNPTEFWQNFKMGEEQEIACNFIFDGLRNLHDIETLSVETELFPVLYNLSIGLERLFKVAIVLVEVNDTTNIDEFEETLKIHNHITLYNRLKKSVDLNFGPAHTGLLTLLSVFYEDHRYGRFNLPKQDNLFKDKELLFTFLSKHLGIEIKDEVFGVGNTLQIKKFIGRTVKKISKDLYKIVEKTATAKNLYTYEISGSHSKAAKIVWGDEDLTFEREEIVMVEVLLFLLKTSVADRVNLLKEIDPLPLDPAIDNEYLQFLLKKRTDYGTAIIDEVESCHQDIKNLKERIEFIKAIKDPNISFDTFNGE